MSISSRSVYSANWWNSSGIIYSEGVNSGYSPDCLKETSFLSPYPYFFYIFPQSLPATLNSPYKLSPKPLPKFTKPSPLPKP